jgi:hypothetical protein
MSWLEATATRRLRPLVPGDRHKPRVLSCFSIQGTTMPRSMRALTLSLFGLLLLSCGGGGNGGGPVGISPPGNFAVAQGTTFDDLTFSWTPSPSSVDGYNLDGAVGSEAFSQINTDLIPKDTIGGALSLNPAMPEQLDLHFRIRSQSGTTYSSYAQANYRRGIKPASTLSGSFDPIARGISLSWVKNTLVADGVSLQRRVFGQTGPSPYAPLPPILVNATSYVDYDIQEGVTYGYQVIYTKGTESSAPVATDGLYFNLAAPGHFTVSTDTVSATLTWVPQSKLATELRIVRSSIQSWPLPTDTPIAVLPPTATSYQDQGLAPGQGYTYRVASFNALRDEFATSPAVSAILKPQPVDSLVFQSQLLLLPAAPGTQMDAQGDWLQWPVQLADQSFGLVTTTPSGVFNQGFGTVDAMVPGIMMDRAFQPHIAYSVPSTTSSAEDLKHSWLDLSGWHTEAVATGSHFSFNLLGTQGIPFLVAPDGTPHLIYGKINYPTLKGVEAVWSPSGWTNTEDPQLVSLAAFALDPAGDLLGIRVVVIPQAGSSTLELWTRDAQGTWSSEAIPGLTVGFGAGADSLNFQVGADGTLHLLAYAQATASTPMGLAYLEKRAGVWSQPEYLTTGAYPTSYNGVVVTICPGDQRIFYAGNLPQGLTLFTRSSGGPWQSTLLLTAGNYPYSYFQGLTVSGKFYLGARLGDVAEHVVLFQEQ